MPNLCLRLFELQLLILYFISSFPEQVEFKAAPKFPLISKSRENLRASYLQEMHPFLMKQELTKSMKSLLRNFRRKRYLNKKRYNRKPTYEKHCGDGHNSNNCGNSNNCAWPKNCYNSKQSRKLKKCNDAQASTEKEKMISLDDLTSPEDTAPSSDDSSTISTDSMIPLTNVSTTSSGSIIPVQINIRASNSIPSSAFASKSQEKHKHHNRKQTYEKHCGDCHNSNDCGSSNNCAWPKNCYNSKQSRKLKKCNDAQASTKKENTTSLDNLTSPEHTVVSSNDSSAISMGSMIPLTNVSTTSSGSIIPLQINIQANNSIASSTFSSKSQEKRKHHNRKRTFEKHCGDCHNSNDCGSSNNCAWPEICNNSKQSEKSKNCDDAQTLTEEEETISSDDSTSLEDATVSRDNCSAVGADSMIPFTNVSTTSSGSIIPLQINIKGNNSIPSSKYDHTGFASKSQKKHKHSSIQILHTELHGTPSSLKTKSSTYGIYSKCKIHQQLRRANTNNDTVITNKTECAENSTVGQQEIHNIMLNTLFKNSTQAPGTNCTIAI